jgi:hypothetical protein
MHQSKMVFVSGMVRQTNDVLQKVVKNIRNEEVVFAVRMVHHPQNAVPQKAVLTLQEEKVYVVNMERLYQYVKWKAAIVTSKTAEFASGTGQRKKNARFGIAQTGLFVVGLVGGTVDFDNF